MKKKIIFATTVFENVSTGPGTFARYLWEAFRDVEDFEFHLVAPDITDSHPQLHGFTINSPREVHRALCREVDRVAAKLGNVGVIHANNAHSMGSLEANIPLICQINDYEVATIWRNSFQLLRQKGLRRFLALAWRHKEERKVANHSTKLLCNSRYVMQSVLDSYKLPASKAEVVYKAVDLDIFRQGEVNEQLNEPGNAGKTKLLFVGSNWQIKGLDLLLEALQSLVKSRKDLTLTVVGSENSEQNQRIRTAYRHLEENGFVQYTGRCSKPDIARMLHQSDIALLPSRQEGFGVSVLEAMSAGTAVIASRVGGLPEIMDGGRYGLLFESGNVTELVECMEKLLHSSELRNEYARLGLERAQLFSKHIMLEKIRSLYLELLGR